VDCGIGLGLPSQIALHMRKCGSTVVNICALLNACASDWTAIGSVCLRLRACTVVIGGVWDGEDGIALLQVVVNGGIGFVGGYHWA